MARAIDNWQLDNKTALNHPKQDTPYSSVWRLLLAYVWPLRLTFVLVFVCILFAITADLLQPYLVKVFIDDYLLAGHGEYRQLILFAGIYFALSLTDFFFTYVQNNLLQFAGQNIVARVRKSLFGHIGLQSISFFDRNPRGNLITHVSSDTETLSQFFSQVLLSLMRDGLTLILIIFMMVRLDWTSTLYCLALLPVIAFIAVSFRSYMRKTYQNARTQISRLVSFVAENLAGMNIVQAFHQQEEQGSRFRERNRSYYRANLREIRTSVLFNRSFDILGNVSVAFLVWIGGKSVLNQELEFGVLYAFITYTRMFFQPISAITQQWSTLQSATVSAGRISNLLSVTPEITDHPEGGKHPEEAVKGEVDFRNVTFGYQEANPVIRDLDLHVEPGETIGIVGTTGAGKSSLISLLCRFYDVQSGSIHIDGKDIRYFPQSELHRAIGLVQQEPFLYSGSVMDNVRLFDETVAKERVIEACRLIGADSIIGRMKHGYETRLSESGSGLSAGERQLISFARILVFKPSILILDEATANMDSYTEQLIQNALEVVSYERTTLVIAHRLSTIVHADRILVMKNGEIVEEGTHGQLLEIHGYYEQLYLHSLGRSKAE
ncbi:ABC transporter ATP-binding protein [Cohnella herbarum]|uniref:ABC transporter ATP-binding protein n=1 Tax=Cohnella herbarum TaxID=2728023 RepID=A0A7Z2VQB2_9BACL|nr:ABC transporter ATP-binding protein [Cohnella herbarum]QJD87279.1 ABC transporter ATP-binding protein [Cohnella herbarum]